jgi:6-phosphogluconolactonase
MTEPSIHVLDDPGAAVAELLAAEARRGGAIALAGGRTPAYAYATAASLEPDWSLASVWWSDERCVPPDDDRSNYLLAAESLLDRLAVLPQVHRIRGEIPPAEAAAEYEELLRGVTLDLVLLGLGDDAHVASLFPESPQLAERERRVTTGPAGLEPFVERVTLTLPALLEARAIVFLVTGAGKAEAVAKAFSQQASDDAPASLLRDGDVPIDVYLDAAAATRL